MPRRSRRTRSAAARGGRDRDFELLRSWGGATIAYRRRLIDSPSYTLNHEEVAKALEEGVRFAEGLTPRGGRGGRFGHAAGVCASQRRRRLAIARHVLPARAILVAAGTQPNTVLAREDAPHSGSTASTSRRRRGRRRRSSRARPRQAATRRTC